MRPAQKLRCVSLFSGCGGLDLGLREAGFNIVLANDTNPNCIKSHEANFPGVPLYPHTVAKLDAKLMAKLSRRETTKAIALVAGGPPCPPFSKSRFYRKEKPRALKDPQGWETIEGFFKVVGSLMPTAFLLENVPGIAYKVHQEALDYLLNSAKKLGYVCAREILNAADYGVPQIRERFIMVGIRGHKFEFPKPTRARPEDEVQKTLFEKSLPTWRSAGEVLHDLDTEANADDEGHFAGGQHNDLLELVPPGDNYLFFTKERGHPNPLFKWRSRYWSFLLKLSPSLPSWTIQARRSNNMGPFHWRNRILRIAEVKRLQTFPDDWKLFGTVEEQWRQVGNAVPPLLARVVGEAIRTQLAQLNKPQLVSAR